MKHILMMMLLTSPYWLLGQSFELNKTFTGHKEQVSYVTFRSEDNLLISGSVTGEIIVWNAQTGKIKERINEHTDKVTHLEFSNNGQMLVSASYDGTIKIWNIRTMEVIRTFKNPSTEAYDEVEGNEPTFATFAPNDRWVYFGGYNLKVLKGNIKTGKMVGIYQHDENSITCGMISPNKKNLVIGIGGNVLFINLKTNKIVKNLFKSNAYQDAICEMAFVPNSTLLTTWAVSGRVQFWDWKLEQREKHLQATRQEGSSDIAFSGDGQYFVTGNVGSQTKVWSVKDRKVIQTLENHDEPVITFAFSSDGKYIVTGSEDNNISLWSKKQAIVRNVERIPQRLRKRKVNVQELVMVKSPYVEFWFWDNKKVDMDTISVNINGAWVVKEHQLDAVPKKVKVKLTSRNNYLVIHAHNEGLIPPNTIAVTIRSGREERLVTLKSDLGTSAGMKILYNPE